ncbi:uncharacterized protein LOC131996243 [Stomoxys calcitrans]|uniref:uncharacterized protein LOC131996243 n=1 Tax=Stomoxys calcitrans TaxID=35570 RepID=UPI0027E3597B|nr:uncharacterized protein LOC131996243 [Stomoxys calcitrans]
MNGTKDADGRLSPHNIEQKMLENVRNWEAVTRYAEQILRRDEMVKRVTEKVDTPTYCRHSDVERQKEQGCELLSQILSGHEYFKKYLHRMGNFTYNTYVYEAEEVEDDAKHTFFDGSHWAWRRRELETLIGDFFPDNIEQKMLENVKNWQAVTRYAEQILRRKKMALGATAHCGMEKK